MSLSKTTTHPMKGETMPEKELTLKKIENGYLVQTWGDETNRTIYCEDLSAVNETLDALFNPPAPVAD